METMSFQHRALVLFLAAWVSITSSIRGRVAQSNWRVTVRAIERGFERVRELDSVALVLRGLDRNQCHRADGSGRLRALALRLR